MKEHIVLVTSSLERFDSNDLGLLAFDLAKTLKTDREVTIIYSRIKWSKDIDTWTLDRISQYKDLGFKVELLIHSGTTGPHPLIVSWEVLQKLKTFNFDKAYFLGFDGSAYYASLDLELNKKLLKLNLRNDLYEENEKLPLLNNYESVLLHDLENLISNKISAYELDSYFDGNILDDLNIENLYRPTNISVQKKKSKCLILGLSDESPYRNLWTNFHKSLVDEEKNQIRFTYDLNEEGISSCIVFGEISNLKIGLFRLAKMGVIVYLVGDTPWNKFWTKGKNHNLIHVKSDVDSIRSIFTFAPTKKIKKIANFSEPLITICMTHKDRPDFLENTLRSLDLQTIINFEVVLIDDGSVLEETIIYLSKLIEMKFRFPLSLKQVSNGWLGRARNEAAMIANGKYLLFIDDDNYALPNEIETFTRYVGDYPEDQVFTCLFYRAESEIPLQGNETQSLALMANSGISSLSLMNWMSDANFLVRKTFFDSVNGFTEDYGKGHEDWEFLIKCTLKNIQIRQIPEPLYIYRASAGGMLSTGKNMSQVRHLSSVADSLETDLEKNFFSNVIYSYIQGFTK